VGNFIEQRSRFGQRDQSIDAVAVGLDAVLLAPALELVPAGLLEGGNIVRFGRHLIVGCHGHGEFVKV